MTVSIFSSLDGYPGAGTDKLALKTIPPIVYGQITLNNGKRRDKSMSLEEGHKRLRNMGNQTDSNDATWI